LTPIVTDKKTEGSEVKDLPNPKPNCPEKKKKIPPTPPPRTHPVFGVRE